MSQHTSVNILTQAPGAANENPFSPGYHSACLSKEDVFTVRYFTSSSIPLPFIVVLITVAVLLSNYFMASPSHVAG